MSGNCQATRGRLRYPSNHCLQPLRASGLELRRQGLIGADIGRVADLYRDGWSLAKLGAEFGCTAETVHKAFKRAGVERKQPWSGLGTAARAQS